jgi:hypothetical protein
LTVYDPFNIINQTTCEVLISSIGKVFNTNYSILFIYNNTALDIRKDEKYQVNGKYLSENYHLIIFIINFRDANTNLISQVLELNSNANLIPIPKQMSHFNSINCNQLKEKDYKNEYEKFYTKKNEDYLPSLLFVFTEDELCLYGFPFSLLENAEIIKSGSLSRFSVIDYLRNFQIFNKIDKRFGK